MNGAFHVGAIGLQAQQRALDVVSNNIANVNTPAFKRSDIRFAAMLAQRGDVEVPTAMPDAILAAAGVTATAAMAMDEGGAIETTGQAMDLAIRGRGFIELLGPDGQVLLWRGGRLALGEDGALIAAGSGLPLRAAVSVPAGSGEIAIAGDGTLVATDAAGGKSEIGRVMIVVPRDPAALEPLDGGLFRVADGAGLDEIEPGSDGAGALVQGGIERSNVDMTGQIGVGLGIDPAVRGAAVLRRQVDRRRREIVAGVGVDDRLRLLLAGGEVGVDELGRAHLRIGAAIAIFDIAAVDRGDAGDLAGRIVRVGRRVAAGVDDLRQDAEAAIGRVIALLRPRIAVGADPAAAVAGEAVVGAGAVARDIARAVPGVDRGRAVGIDELQLAAGLVERLRGVDPLLVEAPVLGEAGAVGAVDGPVVAAPGVDVGAAPDEHRVALRQDEIAVGGVDEDAAARSPHAGVAEQPGGAEHGGRPLLKSASLARKDRHHRHASRPPRGAGRRAVTRVSGAMAGGLAVSRRAISCPAPARPVSVLAPGRRAGVVGA